MGTRKFTDEQELEICTRYLAGESPYMLADHFGSVHGTIQGVLRRNGIKGRSRTESASQSGRKHRKFTDEQEQEVCQRYLAGEVSTQLAVEYGVNPNSILNILIRSGLTPRNRGASNRKYPDHRENEICCRYMAGEDSIQLAKAFGLHPSSVRRFLVSRGIQRRSRGGACDTVQQVLRCSNRFAQPRECELYLYELARYSDTHCKPGIAFDADRRADREYGAEVLRLVLATRGEAYFLEQAVLDATRGSAECPDDLIGWIGASEVRAMPADDLLPIVLRLAAELEAMGPWSFAAAYVPMTAAQRATCQQRSLTLSPLF